MVCLTPGLLLVPFNPAQTLLPKAQGYGRLDSAQSPLLPTGQHLDCGAFKGFHLWKLAQLEVDCTTQTRMCSPSTTCPPISFLGLCFYCFPFPAGWLNLIQNMTLFLIQSHLYQMSEGHL